MRYLRNDDSLRTDGLLNKEEANTSVMRQSREPRDELQDLLALNRRPRHYGVHPGVNRGPVQGTKSYRACGTGLQVDSRVPSTTHRPAFWSHQCGIDIPLYNGIRFPTAPLPHQAELAAFCEPGPSQWPLTGVGLCRSSVTVWANNHRLLL